MTRIEYDPFADSYYTTVDGKEVWSECPVVLEDILHRLDERETRREDARGTSVTIWLVTVLFIVSAWLVRYF